MRLIAIIDDDEPVAAGLASLVRSFGYATCVFVSARDFLASREMPRCSCVITDVQMPGMDGMELLRTLRARGHALPMIFITGFPEDRIRDEALAAGAMGFFSKPFEADALAVCIAGAYGPEGKEG
jgi:FixJ family two-component response regulator